MRGIKKGNEGRVCNVCGDKYYGLGLCKKHYKQQNRLLPKVKKYNVEYLKCYSKTARGRYSALKRAAKDKGLGFDITIEQHILFTAQPCFYCGGKLNPTGHCLDRMDNTVGYVFSNVVNCCYTCNKMKGDWLTFDEMVFISDRLREYRGE